jgi:hypothetical protein
LRGVLVTVAGPNGAAVLPGSASYNNLLAALRAAGDAPAAVIGVVAPPRADGALIEVAPTG